MERGLFGGPGEGVWGSGGPWGLSGLLGARGTFGDRGRAFGGPGRAFGGLRGPLSTDWSFGSPVDLWGSGEGLWESGEGLWGSGGPFGSLGGPLRTDGFLRGWGRGIGSLWGCGRGPHNTVQMELVYYNDHRVLPSNSLLKSSFKSPFKMSLTVSPK